MGPHNRRLAGARRKGISTVVAAVGMIVLLVVGAGVGYFAGTSSSSGATTVTSTSTVQGGGGGGTVTVTASGGAAVSTVTVTSTGSAAGTGAGSAPQDLVALAKAQGGKITLYSIQDPGTWAQYVQPAFMAAYPWAQMTYLPLDPPSLITRPAAELQAGKVTADLVLPSNGAITNLVNAKVCAATVQMPSYMANLGYPKESYDSNGVWWNSWASLNVIAYNTKLITQPPKNWTDLANPIYNNKIAFADVAATNFASDGVFAALYTVMGNSSWTKLMNGIKANHPNLTPSAGTAYSLVANGQAGVAIVSLTDVIAGIAQNQPVAVAWTNPVVEGTEGICITQGAPDPAMALLFAMWLESPAGQLAEIKAGQVSANPIINSYAFKIVPANTSLVVPTNYFSNKSYWVSLLTQIYKGQ